MRCMRVCALWLGSKGNLWEAVAPLGNACVTCGQAGREPEQAWASARSVLRRSGLPGGYGGPEWRAGVQEALRQRSTSTEHSNALLHLSIVALAITMSRKSLPRSAATAFAWLVVALLVVGIPSRHQAEARPVEDVVRAPGSAVLGRRAATRARSLVASGSTLRSRPRRSLGLPAPRRRPPPPRDSHASSSRQRAVRTWTTCWT